MMIQAGFSDDGTVNGIVMDVYTNSGCHNNDQAVDVAMSYIDNGLLLAHTHTHVP